MLTNYFKTASRNIFKHKLLYSINFLGLIIGMTTSMILLNYVIFERSFDKFHTQRANIYRIISEPFKDGVELDKSVPIPYTHGDWLANEYPEVLDYIRIRIPGGIAGLNSISYRDKEFSNDQVYFADQKFLQYFSFPLIKGNSKTALSEIFSVVLTESTARKYFGDEEPMGKLLNVKSKKYEYTCEVTGIMKDLPRNSSMKFDLIFSFLTYMYQDDKRLLDDPMRHSFNTFLVLAPGTDAVKLTEKYEPFLKERMPEFYTKILRFKFSLQKLTDIHLHSSSYLYDRNEKGNWKTVYFFATIALLVLSISVVNYISFFSIQAFDRVKELGIRKVLGGSKHQITFQFIIESFVINFIAFGSAILLTFAIAGYFDQLTDKNTPLIIFSDFYYATGLIIAVITISIVSGTYPAFVLSSLKPTTALIRKVDYKSTRSGINFRNALTIFQFAISLIAIICTIIIYLQIDFMRSQDLGFTADQVLLVKAPAARDSVMQTTREIFVKELKRNANILNVSQSNSIPGNDGFDSDVFAILGDNNSMENNAVLYALQVDHNFMNTYNFKFISGKNFSEDARANETSVIINETVLRRFNFKDADDALGAKFYNYHSIIGVVKSHRHLHFTKDYYPFVYYYKPSRFVYISIKYSQNNESEVISVVESKWKDFFPEEPFEYFFQDEFYYKLYKDDISLGKIFGWTALLAVILSCIGVFGLAYFDVIRRTKEIGIRKVIGANRSSLMATLSKSTVILFIIANLIAWPIAYYLMRNWLNNYSARIEMPMWVYVVCCVIVFFLVLTTMSLQFFNIAKRNPAENLRAD